jgi:tetratricopeptide (TPR) repeat protein
MLKYEPPEFEHRLKKALTELKEILGVDPDELQGDFFNPIDRSYNKEEFDDHLITPSSICLVSFPFVDYDYEMTYQDLIDFAKETGSATLEGNIECWTDKRLLLRVEEEYLKAELYYDYAFHEITDHISKNLFNHKEQIEGREISCSLVRGFTVFGLLIVASGDYDKYFPPIMEDELFVQIRFAPELSKSVVRNIAEAYIFELSSSSGIHLTPSPRPLHQSFEEWEEIAKEANRSLDDIKLRPLLIGKGMKEILQLYNRAIQIADHEVKLLFLTKVIEYVSPTIIRQKLTTSVQNKLSSNRALNPDAKFIAELDVMFQELRSLRKEREAISLTIEQCCDLAELRTKGPPFLKELQAVSPDSQKGERQKALKAFAATLSATRNSIAHAKANYEPTGDECPETEIEQFVQCVEMAAQQVVRWFARCPEHLKIL